MPIGGPSEGHDEYDLEWAPPADEARIADTVLSGARHLLLARARAIEIDRSIFESGPTTSWNGVGAVDLYDFETLAVRDTAVRFTGQEGVGVGARLMHMRGAGVPTATLDRLTFGPGQDEFAEDVTFGTWGSPLLTVHASRISWGGALVRFEYGREYRVDEVVDVVDPPSDFTCTTGGTAISLECGPPAGP